MDHHTKTPNKANSHRDVTAHRRAHLDSYARARKGISDVIEVPVTQVQPKSQPLPSVQATVVAAITPVAHQQKQAPVVVKTAVAPQKVAVGAPIEPVERRSYLDTLTHHHQQRVATAPQAIETVTHPALTENTQHLIDVDAQRRIEANLNALYNPKPLTAQITKSQTSASAMHVRTIVASAMACGVLSVGIFAFSGRYNPQPVVAEPIGAPVIEVEAPVSGSPKGSPVNTHADYSVSASPTDPVRIIAASIGVNARVDGLGNTPDGLIAVPRAYTTVGWYNKGSTVGQPGPAVFVGHYTGGYGGVFDKLKDIKNGDLITIKNGKNEVFTYKVTALNEYAKDQVPMTEIFKKSDNSRLEIITCSGKWQSNSYNNRIVVSAELVQ